MPEDVKDVFGQAILDLQFGETPVIAKVFAEGAPREVWKLVDNHDGDTYRVAYTAVFDEAIYVLHAFQKKSKSRIGTPKQHLDLVARRFQAAQADYRERLLHKGATDGKEEDRGVNRHRGGQRERIRRPRASRG